MDHGADRGIAVSDSGVRIGTVDGSRTVRDDRGVRVGTATSDDAVVDFAGVRIGRVVALAAGSGPR
jgi:hypothetical protein